MELQQNVGGIDRLARGVFAVVLLAAGGWFVLAGRTLVGALALAGAVGLGLNAVTGFCGLNALLGIDTCSRTVEQETG